MKKRLFSIFLAALMLLTLLPVTALAEEEYATYGTWICGTQVTDENLEDVFGDGKVSYIPETEQSPARLTLKGASLTDVDLGMGVLYSIEDLEIELIGTNTLIEKASETDAIYGCKDLTFMGTGSIDVSGSCRGDEKITISDDSTVNICADGYPAVSTYGEIEITDNADMTAESVNSDDGTAVYSARDIVITTGGKVEVKATCTDIECEYWGSGAVSAQNITFGGSGTTEIAVCGGKAVIAYGQKDNFGEYAGGGNITFGCSAVVTVNHSGSEDHAVYALGDMTASDSAQVSVSTAGAGVAIYAKNVGIGDSAAVNASAVSNSAIWAYGSYEQVTGKYFGVGDITVDGSAGVTAKSIGGESAVYAAGTVTLTTADKISASVDDPWNNAISARNITVGGKGTVEANGMIYVREGSLTIGDSVNVTVTADLLYAYQNVIITTGGKVDVSGEIYAGEGGVTFGGSGTLTAKDGIKAQSGGVTLGGSGKVIAEGSIEASYDNVTICDSVDVTVTVQGEGVNCISNYGDVIISTTGVVRLESKDATALMCNNNLKITNTVGKILLYGKYEAMKVRADLDLAAGLAFYGAAKQDAAESEMIARATYKDHTMFVGNDTAQSLVLRRTPVASILQLLSNTVATINQVRKVTRTAALLALPAVLIVNRMIFRLFR